MLDQEEKLPVQEEKLSSENSETAEEQKSTIQPTLEKNTSTNVAVDEIESKIAESSENTEHPAIEMEDYGKLSLDELVEESGKLVREGQVQSINNNVNKIAHNYTNFARSFSRAFFSIIKFWRKFDICFGKTKHT